MYMSAVHFERDGGASMRVLCDTLISLSLWRRERVSGSASRALCDALIDFTAARVLVSGFQGVRVSGFKGLQIVLRRTDRIHCGGKNKCNHKLVLWATRREAHTVQNVMAIAVQRSELSRGGV